MGANSAAFEREGDQGRMQDIISLSLPFFGLIFLGFGAGKFIDLPESGLAWLNFFVIYLALPSLFFQLLSQTPIDQIANWSFIFGTTFSSYTAFAIAFCIGIVITAGRIPEATMQGLIAGYANVGYMGPGLTLAAFGAHATVPAALIFCFDVTLFFILAPMLMAISGTEQREFLPTAIAVAKRIFLHPFILSCIAGITAAATGLRPPDAIDQLLDYLKSAAAPCALFAMGVTIALRPLRKVPTELALFLAIKLILHPIIVLLTLSWIGGFDPIWVNTAILMACLPPAATSFVIAQQYNVYVERTSSAIMIGTLVSVVTVTAFLYAIKNGLLPL